MRPAWNAASRGGCCSHGGARCFLCLTGRNVRNHRLFQPCSPWGIVREFFSGGVSLGALSVFLVYNVVLASVQSVVAPQNLMRFSPGQYSCAYSLSRAPGACVGVSGFSLSRAPCGCVGVSGFFPCARSPFFYHVLSSFLPMESRTSWEIAVRRACSTERVRCLCGCAVTLRLVKHAIFHIHNENIPSTATCGRVRARVVHQRGADEHRV